MSQFGKPWKYTPVSHSGLYRGHYLSCPPAYKTKTVQYNLEREESNIRKVRKKFQTHNPPRSSLDALTTERLEAGKFFIIIATLAGRSMLADGL